MVANQVQALLDETSALDPFQSRFRPHHSMKMALFPLHDEPLGEADSSKMSLLILLNLSMAFDTVDHSILLGRLSRLRIGGLALSWFRSFLEDHPETVQLGAVSYTHLTLPTKA